jgi:adhesin HecA-like repeat protein
MFAAIGAAASKSLEGHVSVALLDGRILMVSNTNPQVVFDLATMTFDDVGGLTALRVFETVDLLPDGRVLVAGGLVGTTGAVAVSTTELFDPTTDSFDPGPDMGAVRARAASSPLPDGRVLILGGNQGTIQNVLDDAVIFDASDDSFTPAVGTIPSGGRMFATATLLDNGRVLFAAGQTTGGMVSNYVDLY